MKSAIQKINLKEKSYSFKANNPFEDFAYLRAMEQSESAAEISAATNFTLSFGVLSKLT